MVRTFHIQTEMLNEKEWILSDFVTVNFWIYWIFLEKYQSSPFDACYCMQTYQHTYHQFDVFKIQHASLLFMTLKIWEIAMNQTKERSKISNWTVDHFSLTFVNLLLASMLDFQVWLHSKGKILSFEWIL